MVHQKNGIGKFLHHVGIATQQIVRKRFFEIFLGIASVGIGSNSLGYRSWHVVDARHHLAVEETVILLAGLHQEGKRGKLLGTGVEVDANDVLAQDAVDGLRAAVAFLYVEGIEQVETLVKDVSRATGKVGNGQLCEVVNL